MASEMSEAGSAFAETACKLLIEYTARLVTQKQEASKILDRFYDARGSSKLTLDSSYLRDRYENERKQFFNSREVFEALIRKSSQWIEHGRSPRPHLQMELELRLADFESTLRSVDEFFNSHFI